MKYLIIFFCLLLMGCANGNGVVKSSTACGKITIDPTPLMDDIPADVKSIKPKQTLPPSNSGGVFFPKSAFSILEFNISKLRGWINSTREKIEIHNYDVDQQLQKIKKEHEKKKEGWFKWL